MKFKFIVMTLLIITSLNIEVGAVEVDVLEGNNRYETAAKIAEKMVYDKAVIVNGLALVDGLAASGLSGTLDAPILLTYINRIPDVTLEALEGVNEVYIVGGTGVVSLEIEEELKSRGIKVVRLGGKNRYETSYQVADLIEEIKGISEIYYVNGLVGESDAMSIAPVAAKNENPVILTNGSSTSYIRDVKGYIIGGEAIMSAYFEEYGTRLGGKNRFETNKLVIEEFFDDKSEVYLSKSDVLVDALTSSALKKPVVLVNEHSDKSILAGSKELIALGGVDERSIARAKSYVHGDAVVFYVQHQDDETLFAGSAIVDAIESVGSENVYIVLITKGNRSNVFNQDRYINLSNDERAELRNNEFKAATNKLGVLDENLIFLNYDEYHLNYNEIMYTIESFEEGFETITHITHSYKYDIHTDHVAIGEFILELYKRDIIEDVRFFAHINEGNKIPVENLIESVSDNEEERIKVIEACEEYGLDNGDMIREGIGYKSVKWLFDNLKLDSKVRSFLHTPGV